MASLEKIAEHLKQEGLADLSASVAEAVCGLLSWKPSSTADHPNCVIAFSFGFKFDESGNRQPGEANEQLARYIMDLYATRPIPVHAQWEIALAIGDRVPTHDLHSIKPKIVGMKKPDDVGVEYLSSRGVVDQAVGHGAKEPVLVVAHRLHLFRCAEIVKSAGLSVVVHPELMPVECSGESGQLWTSDREVYVLSDMISRLGARRDRLYKLLEGKRKQAADV